MSAGQDLVQLVDGAAGALVLDLEEAMPDADWDNDLRAAVRQALADAIGSAVIAAARWLNYEEP